MDGATLSPETLGEVRVQRDMDLVRRIMKEIRLRSDIRARPVEIDGVDPVVLGRHVEMLFKAGLVEGTPHASSGRPYTDRKSVVSGKSVSVRVDLGGRRIIKKKKTEKNQHSITRNNKTT